MTSVNSQVISKAIIIGGGPSGLMAAEALSMRGVEVHIYDAMPSLGRKFLMAGKSGLNITHAENAEKFMSRYGTAEKFLSAALNTFTPTDIWEWCEGLGIEVFVGTSQRIFPVDFKAAPLLRSWMRRLRKAGVKTHVRHKWQGWTEAGDLKFSTPDGDVEVKSDTTILALGGGSWPKLGSDGSWMPWLDGRGVTTSKLRPANCGFNREWSPFFLDKFAGSPLKNTAMIFDYERVKGEFVVTKSGIESGIVYTLSAPIRDKIEADGSATVLLDLLPDLSEEKIVQSLSRPRGSKSMATHLKKSLNIRGVKAGLLRELLPAEAFNDDVALARGIKALPLELASTSPLEEAISSAGGISLKEVDEGFQLKKFPGLYCVGEMLDWEAPTGGYLLTACMAIGRAAGNAAADVLVGPVEVEEPEQDEELDPDQEPDQDQDQSLD